MKNAKKRILTITIIGLFATSGLIVGMRLMPSDESLVLVNQVGYLSDMEKVVLFQTSQQERASNARFDVVTEAGTVVLQDQPMNYEGELWGYHYASGNFSAVQTGGTYQVVVRSGGSTWNSPLFQIGNDSYKDVLRLAVIFYYYQRCGIKAEEIIPGYVGHEACHMDDGIWKNETGHFNWKNTSGGWHDAGDYGKYMEFPTNTQLSVYALAYAYETAKNYFDNLNESLYETPAPDVVDETVWGARFLQKMIVKDQYGDSRVLSGVYGVKNGEINRFSYWGAPSGETDNIPGTEDDRVATSGYNASGDIFWKFHENGPEFVNNTATLMVAAAMAKSAWIQKDFPYWDDDVVNSTNLLANATDLHDVHIEGVLYPNNTVIPGKQMFDLWTAVASALELARWANHTGDNTAWNKYIAQLNPLRFALLEAIPGTTSALWDHPHESYLVLRQVDTFLNGSMQPDLIANLTDYGTNTLLKAANATGNIFNYFKNWDNYFGFYGTNWVLSSASSIAMMVWNVTGLEFMKNYAADNVAHFIMGRNPFGICQFEGLGTVNPSIYHHRYVNIPNNIRGALPGCVPNGIAGTPTDDPEVYLDLPWFDLSEPNPESRDLGDFRSNEPYITDNAGFLLGFSNLVALW
ncbi:MAG: glycoside hydrolase family 9 protein [Candidatus Hodarchaeota archaeon]